MHPHIFIPNMGMCHRLAESHIGCPQNSNAGYRRSISRKEPEVYVGGICCSSNRSTTSATHVELIFQSIIEELEGARNNGSPSPHYIGKFLRSRSNPNHPMAPELMAHKDARVPNPKKTCSTSLACKNPSPAWYWDQPIKLGSVLAQSRSIQPMLANRACWGAALWAAQLVG